MDIRYAIWLVSPVSEYQWLSLGDDNYASIGEWRDENTTKPTLQELQTAWDAYLVQQAAIDAAAQTKATAETNAVTNYGVLPAFVKTMTADEAVAQIHSQIFNGQTAAQINTYVDTTIGTVTGANLAAALTSINTQLGNVRTVLKAAGAAIIAMRDLFELIAKLLIYIRDLVIRFRQ